MKSYHIPAFYNLLIFSLISPESSPEKSENFAENSGNFPEKENFPEESKKNSENYSQKSQNSPDKINQG
eukprot:1383878-Amorphochlora_amoeboformis.AAC.2